MWEYTLRVRGAAGVDLAIVSPTCPNVYFGDAETSLNAARGSNDAMAAAAWPNRIRGADALALFSL